MSIMCLESDKLRQLTFYGIIEDFAFQKVREENITSMNLHNHEQIVGIFMFRHGNIYALFLRHNNIPALGRLV